MSAQNNKCLVCQNPVTDRAHIRSKGAGGKDDPNSIMYLCRNHHRIQHQLGIGTFAKMFPAVEKDMNKKGWVIKNEFGILKLRKA